MFLFSQVCTFWSNHSTHLTTGGSVGSITGGLVGTGAGTGGSVGESTGGSVGESTGGSVGLSTGGLVGLRTGGFVGLRTGGFVGGNDDCNDRVQKPTSSAVMSILFECSISFFFLAGLCLLLTRRL